MAIIRCGTDEDGNLIPLTVEFELGDVVQVQGNQRAKSIEVQRSFTLEGMSAYFQQLLTWLNADGSATVRHDHPDPKLPAPPPEDGAFTLAKSGDKVITLIIDE